MAVDTRAPGGSFPEGDEFEKHLRNRQRFGRFWHVAFFCATLVGIIALLALLSNVANDAAGYVALQNKVDPESLVVNFYKDKMLAASNVLASEDDEELAAAVTGNPDAIGFFGYAYYDEHANDLKLVAVDGVTPSAATVESGEYKLARPLFIYSTEQALQQKPQVAAFVAHYLNNVNRVIDSVGYFPVSEATLQDELKNLEAALGTKAALPTGSVAGDIVTVGSSTVAPITQRMADEFNAAGGYSGAIKIDNIGTDAGFRAFCVDKAADIANASRPMINIDLAACRQKRLTPVEFRIANDGIALVVSKENDFLTNVTLDQLQQIFTTAEKWSDVDPSWPNRPIQHFIPGKDSGTLDFFTGAVYGSDLATQPAGVLAEILKANISAGRLRVLEAAQPLAERSQADLVALLDAEVIKPKVVQTWPLYESLFNRDKVEAEAAQIKGSVDLKFRSWVNWTFLTSPQSSDPLKAGIATAILGSLWVTLIAFLVAIPLGTAAAIYLEEYSTGSGRIDQIIETNINNLAGVPSIIYGMLGLAVFVRFLGPITSGIAFGVSDPTTANGRTILSAGLTLGVLILPLVIINAREAIRAVPRALREGALGLGATRWQTTWSHVLPTALPGILTGVILAVSRAFGETAPLIVVGVSTFIVVNPDSVFSKYTTLPAQIYQWTSRPQQEFQHLAAAAIVVLLILLLALNAGAIYLRNRYASRRV